MHGGRVRAMTRPTEKGGTLLRKREDIFFKKQNTSVTPTGKGRGRKLNCPPHPSLLAR